MKSSLLSLPGSEQPLGAQGPAAAVLAAAVCPAEPQALGAHTCSNSMKAALGCARPTRVCPVWLAPACFPKPQHGEVAPVGRRFLADTVTSLIFFRL